MFEHSDHRLLDEFREHLFSISSASATMLKDAQGICLIMKFIGGGGDRAARAPSGIDGIAIRLKRTHHSGFSRSIAWNWLVDLTPPHNGNDHLRQRHAGQ
jgi:hypothetical protein